MNKQDALEIIHRQIADNILSLFQQVIVEQYRLHLFDLHLMERSRNNKPITFPNELNVSEAAKAFSAAFNENKQEQEFAFRKTLHDKVNVLKSDLFSLINAVHKSDFIHQVFFEYFPIKFDYEQIKAMCFERVKHINEQYNNGKIHPFHSKNIATFGVKYEQQNVHFDPHYYYGSLHKYFNQVETTNIVRVGENHGVTHFAFQYVFYPLFHFKEQSLSQKQKAIEAILDSYFNSVQKPLMNVQSPMYIQRWLKTDENPNVKHNKQKGKARVPYKSAFLFKNYTPLLITNDFISADYTKMINSVIMSDYDPYQHTFNETGEMNTIIRRNKDSNFFVLPIQFVFNTEQAYKNIKKTDRSQYLGFLYLYNYLKADNTASWLDRLLMDYIKLTPPVENQYFLELMGDFPNLTFSELIRLLAESEWGAIIQSNPNIVREKENTLNTFPTLQFASRYFLSDYVGRVERSYAYNPQYGNLKGNVIDTISLSLGEIRDKNKVGANQSHEDDYLTMLENIGMQLNPDSLWRLLDSIFNQTPKEITAKNLRALENYEVGGLVLLPELTLNHNEYSWLTELFNSAVKLLNHNDIVVHQITKQIRAFDAKLPAPKSIENNPNRDMYSYVDKEKKEIHPIAIISPRIGETLFDISLDDLIFDSDKTYPNLTLTVTMFFDNPFSQEEITTRKFNVRQHLDKAIFTKDIALNSNSYEILQGWKTIRHYVEVALKNSMLITAINSRFDSGVLCGKSYQYEYDNKEQFDIMLSINV